MQGNALKKTKLKKSFFKLQVKVLWKWVINILVDCFMKLAALFDIIW